MRLAHPAPSRTADQKAAERVAEGLSGASGGTMAVDILPGGAPGDLGQLQVQTRMGALDPNPMDLGASAAMRAANVFAVRWTPFLLAPVAPLAAPVLVPALTLSPAGPMR